MNDTTSYNEFLQFYAVLHAEFKSSDVKLSKSFIVVSSNKTPTGILPTQSIQNSIDLCYIGVLSSTRVGNFLYSPKVYVVLDC